MWGIKQMQCQKKMLETLKSPCSESLQIEHQEQKEWWSSCPAILDLGIHVRNQSEDHSVFGGEIFLYKSQGSTMCVLAASRSQWMHNGIMQG